MNNNNDLSTNQPAILTQDEIIAITGYQKPKLQEESLRKMGIPATLNARNRVVVFRQNLSQPLPGKNRQADNSWMDKSSK